MEMTTHKLRGSASCCRDKEPDNVSITPAGSSVQWCAALICDCIDVCSTLNELLCNACAPCTKDHITL